MALTGTKSIDDIDGHVIVGGDAKKKKPAGKKKS